MGFPGICHPLFLAILLFQPGFASSALLPDPLVMASGKKIENRKQWENERKPELKRLFAQFEYGEIPPAPKKETFIKMGSYENFLGGAARLRLLKVNVDEGRGPQIDLMVVLPRATRARVPVFLAMDFCGNHALTDDPRVPLSTAWFGKNCPGCTNGAATEAARGSQATNWPLEEIVRRGYGFAAFYQGDVDSDRPEASTGLYAWLAAERTFRKQSNQSRNPGRLGLGLSTVRGLSSDRSRHRS